MEFREKDRVVNARLLSETIHTEQGELLAGPGDYLVVEGAGEIRLCSAEVFTKRYEPTSGPCG